MQNADSVRKVRITDLLPVGYFGYGRYFIHGQPKRYDVILYSSWCLTVDQAAIYASTCANLGWGVSIEIKKILRLYHICIIGSTGNVREAKTVGREYRPGRVFDTWRGCREKVPRRRKRR